VINDFTTTDPRGAGLARAIGATVNYVTGGAIVPLVKYGTAATDWCTVPQGGAATPTTSDPRSAGRSGLVGSLVMYVTGGAGLLLRKYGTASTNWATVPTISVSGGALADGDYGDITVGGGGTTMAVDAGAINTTKLGGDITAVGKALLDDATAADQRTTLGLGTAAVNSAASFEAAGNVAAHSGLTSGVHGITAFGATLVDDANAAAARTTLGLATVASSASASDLTAGTVATARLGSGTANSTTFLRGDQTWAAPAGGSAASGTATLSFGAFPGAHETLVTVSDTGVVAGSVPMVSIRFAATGDHSADEHFAEAPNFELVVVTITAGVGFNVSARYNPPVREPLSFPGGRRFHGANATAGLNTFGHPTIVPTVGGAAPRTYGDWTIQWIRI
jgi:hypothetical protein